MEQIEESRDYVAAADNETWRAALVEKCAAQERIALLDEPVRAMSAGEEIDLRFLEKTNYDDKGTPLSEE